MPAERASRSRSPLDWALWAVALLCFVAPATAVFLVAANVYFDGGSNSLDGARNVSAHPSQARVFVASQDDGVSMVFEQDGDELTATTSDSTNSADVVDVEAVDDGLWILRQESGGTDVTRVVFRRLDANGDLVAGAGAVGSTNNTQSGGWKIVAKPGGPLVDGLQSRYLAYVSADDLVRVMRATVSSNTTVTQVESWDVEALPGIDFWGMSVSPDGANLYAAVPAFDRLYIFELETSGSFEGQIDGSPTFIEEGDPARRGSVSGLSTVRSTETSPDGEFVYTGSTFDGITVFDRNTTDGSLSFVSNLALPSADIQELAISPDGRFLAAADPAGDRVYLYSRNESTGALTLEDTINDTDLVAGGLDGVRGLAFDRDSQYLFAASVVDDALVVLELPIFFDGFEDGTTDAWN